MWCVWLTYSVTRSPMKGQHLERVGTWCACLLGTTVALSVVGIGPLTLQQAAAHDSVLLASIRSEMNLQSQVRTVLTGVVVDKSIRVI